MEKSCTSPYHPSGNGMTECLNSTLLNIIGTLDPDLKTEWQSRVSSLVHAYNCTPHSMTQLMVMMTIQLGPSSSDLGVSLGSTAQAGIISESELSAE